jgi:hypothetical protein
MAHSKTKFKSHDDKASPYFKALWLGNVVLYYIYSGNEHVSTTVSDVDRHVVIRELPDSILRTLHIFKRRLEIQT